MNKKKVLSYRKVILIIIFGLLLSVSSFSLAKYIIQEFHSYYLNAKHFYFTSNRLKKNNPTYLVNNWSGVGSFNISFDLLSQKNSLVYTDYDIPYKVTFECPDGVTCNVDKSSGVIYSASITHSDTVTVSVNPSRNYVEGERLSIHIVATSTEPYVETISANFEYVVGKQGITYEIEDETNRPYMVLKITSAINYCEVTQAFDSYNVGDYIESSVYRSLSATDKSKCIGEPITLTFDPNVILLDTTSDIVNLATISNTAISGTDYVSRLEFNIEPVSTMAIKFYKHNTSTNYTYPYENSSSIVTVSFSS